jgi:6,7-dimethyl-8-ribityllumazine synthase
MELTSEIRMCPGFIEVCLAYSEILLHFSQYFIFLGFMIMGEMSHHCYMALISGKEIT